MTKTTPPTPDTPPPGDALSHGVILFDGVCNFCNQYVNYVIDHDPADYFRFTSLQSERGAELAGQHGIDANELSTVIFLADGKAYLRSGAVLRIMGRLRGPVKLLKAFLIVPAPLRDWGYKFVAKRRYKWFGQRDECRLPTPSDKLRFLEDPVDRPT